MSRTRLSVLTALALVVLAVAVYFARLQTGGASVEGPSGASTWEVTLTARGRLPGGKDGTIVTAAPPDFRRQHIYDERFASAELLHREGRADTARSGATRDIIWKSRPAAAGRNYRLTYTFRCVLGRHQPSHAMRERTQRLDNAPGPTDPSHRSAARIESDDRTIRELARSVAGERTAHSDLASAFYEYVLGLPYYETEGNGGALDCLTSGGGNETSRSRLLAALCRSRGIPARVVTGVVLNPNSQPTLHHWVEIWVGAGQEREGHWLPACPTYGHFGWRRWPGNYLVLRLTDDPLAWGAGDAQVSLFARQLPDLPPAGGAAEAFWQAVSFAGLPPAEQQLVRFLVLLPPAVLIISFFRVVIGIPTYGIFSPALLGLIFRDPRALPWGLGIFVATVLVGWLIRRFLDRYHLLLIPRAGALLSLIVLFLLAMVVVASHLGVAITNYVALFPLIILTHMVERFWTVEAEDGTQASFKTLLGTVVVAASVSLALGPEIIGRWLFRHPETLGVVIAALLLLGRYTGYRVSELYRFKDLIEFDEKAKDESPAPKVDAKVETA